MNTPPIRDDVLASTGLDTVGAKRETILLAGFLFFLADTMPGRGGRGSAKLQSNFQMVLAVRRVHERLGARMEILHGVRKVYDSILRKFVAVNGPEALVPLRKEPLDGPRIAKLFEIPNGTVLGSKTVNWQDSYWIAWRALLSCGFAAAFRKAELVPPQPSTAGPRDLKRASISWIIAGTAVVNPTIDQLFSLTTGDFCVIKPPTSKADPFGLHFTSKPIFLPFGHESINAAKNIAALIVAAPVDSVLQGKVPSFCFATNGGAIFTQAETSRLLQQALKSAFPLEDTNRWSMHSLRIGAATALLAAGASMELIQALCRWRSPKSVNIYARLGAQQ